MNMSFAIHYCELWRWMKARQKSACRGWVCWWVSLEPLYMQLLLDLTYSGKCIYQTLMTHCIVVLNFRSLCVIFKLRKILFRSDSLCNSLIVMGTVCRMQWISASWHACLRYGESSYVCISTSLTTFLYHYREFKLALLSYFTIHKSLGFP